MVLSVPPISHVTGLTRHFILLISEPLYRLELATCNIVNYQNCEASLTVPIVHVLISSGYRHKICRTNMFLADIF